MKKHYKDIIKELEYPEFGTINPFATAFKLLIEIDPYSMRIKQCIYDVMVALDTYFNNNGVDVKVNLENVISIDHYFNEVDYFEVINILKKTSTYNINLLILNLLLKDKNKIYCEFKKDEFLDYKNFSGNYFLIYDEEKDGSMKSSFDFDNPIIDLLDYVYLMLQVLYDLDDETKKESEYILMLENDDVEKFSKYLMKYNYNLKDYTNNECGAIVLDIIRSGAKNINILLDMMNVDPFSFPTEPKNVFASALISNSFDIIKKYFDKKPKSFILQDLLFYILRLDEEVFDKVYELYPFNDIDFILNYPDKDAILSKNIIRLIDKECFDLNRYTNNVNVFNLILQKCDLEDIKYAINKGGNIFNTCPKYSSNNNFMYNCSSYANVLLNDNQECIDYIIKQVPKKTIFNDLTPAVMLLDKEDIETFDRYISEGYIDLELIKNQGSFLLDFTIYHDYQKSFRYIVRYIFGPNAFCFTRLPILIYVLIKKRDEMLDFLLKYKTLNLNTSIKPFEVAIKENYVYGVKRLIEVGAVYKNISPFTPGVSKRKKPEIYKLLKEIVPKSYYIKNLIKLLILIFLSILVIYGLWYFIEYFS